MRASWLVIGALALWGCSKDDGSGEDAGTTTPDASVSDLGDASTRTDTNVPGDMTQQPGSRVELDLTPYLPAPANAATAKIYQLEDDNGPFSGPVVASRTGDWIIENELVRVAIEADKRAMSPCPWGGTPIDAAYIADGDNEDILGEVCSLMNGGLAFRPDTFEVVADGADGGAAVLAASGTFAVNDFLNLPTMIGDYLPNFEDRIGIDINGLLPLRVTSYYILAPGDTSVTWLMAMRNDAADEQVDVLPIFLVASGGDGFYYNPLSSSGGFGADGGSVGLALDSLPFLGYNGQRASYSFAPFPNPDLAGSLLPIGGSYLIISNVAAIALGISSADLLTLLTASEEVLARSEQLYHLQPTDVQTIEMRLFVGDGALSTMVDGIYEKHAVPTGKVTGVVQDPDGNPVEGARVSALYRGFRSTNQTISAADGTFELSVPYGDYEFIARKGAWSPAAPVELTIDAGDHDAGVLNLNQPGALRVAITTPDDGCADTTGPQPVPARLTVICVDECIKPALTEADTQFHRLPDNYQAVVYGGNDGIIDLDLPAGDYDIVVSRGMEWSIWPPTAPNTLHRVSITPGGLVEVDAEIARVLDTGDAYSGDFHIHSVPSPDSPVGYVDRVLNFAAEGVDLLVATDHDHITDHRPIVTTLALEPWIQAVVGEEITTSDLGHFNAFPLVADPTHSRGGAVDWGGGDSYTLLPSELYAALNAFPGEQVVQMNHAGGLGFIKMAEADVLRGITYADRTKHRLPPQEEAGKTVDDTGFWSDGFSAMELMNGNSQSRFYRLGRWWMQMIGRGFSPTGTGVTDTHKLYGDLGGVPRTYVWGNDTSAACGDRRFANLGDYDAFIDNFAQRTNAGAAIGTNGPFARVWVDGDGIAEASLGETAATGGAPFVAHIEIQTAEWVRPNAIDVYLNPPLASVDTLPGQLIEDPIPAQQTVPIVWDEAQHLTTVTTGTVEHKVWRQTIDVPLESLEDAFLIFVVKGGQSMQPVTPSGPFMFTNPIFIDADGNGYDNPPYAEDAAVLSEQADRVPKPTASDPITPEELIRTVRAVDCQHPSHDH